LSTRPALSNHAQTPALITAQKNDFAVHDFAIPKNAGTAEKKQTKKLARKMNFDKNLVSDNPSHALDSFAKPLWEPIPRVSRGFSACC
jgi:hypothetical protein